MEHRDNHLTIVKQKLCGEIILKECTNLDQSAAMQSAAAARDSTAIALFASSAEKAFFFAASNKEGSHF